MRHSYCIVLMKLENNIPCLDHESFTIMRSIDTNYCGTWTNWMTSSRDLIFLHHCYSGTLSTFPDHVFRFDITVCMQALVMRTCGQIHKSRLVEIKKSSYQSFVLHFTVSQVRNTAVEALLYCSFSFSFLKLYFCFDPKKPVVIWLYFLSIVNFRIFSMILLFSL